MKNKVIKKCLGKTLSVVLVLSIIFTTLVTVSVGATEASIPLCEDFESITDTGSTPSGWTQFGGTVLNAPSSIQPRTDGRGGKYLQLTQQTSSHGAKIGSGMTIGTKPIITSCDILLNPSAAKQYFFIGMTKGNTYTTPIGNLSYGMWFYSNDPATGNWAIYESGSKDGGNNNGNFNLNGEKYAPAHTALTGWHHVDMVYNPASGENAATVDYYIDGQKLSVTNTAPVYVQDNATLGDFYYMTTLGKDVTGTFGIDNLEVKEYDAAADDVKVKTITAGDTSININWDATLASEISNADVSIVKYATLADKLNSTNAVADAATITGVDKGGIAVTIPAATAGEQYVIKLAEKTDIFGNQVEYEYHLGVAKAVGNDDDVQEVEAYSNNFEVDTVDELNDGLSLNSSNAAIINSTLKTDDNCMEITRAREGSGTDGTSYAVINPKVSVDDIGLEYVDIYWDQYMDPTYNTTDTNANLRGEVYLLNNNTDKTERFFIKSFGSMSQVKVGTGTRTVKEDAGGANESKVWYNYKLRLEINAFNGSQYKYTIQRKKSTDAEYADMTTYALINDWPSSDGMLGVFKIAYITYGPQTNGFAIDNLKVVKGFDKATYDSRCITGVEFADENGKIASEKIGAKQIKVYSSNANPDVLLKQGETKIARAGKAVDGVSTMVLETGLAGGCEYTLEIDGKEYTFTTEAGTTVYSNPTFNVDEIPSAGEAVKASVSASNTEGTKYVYMIVATYKGLVLENVSIEKKTVVTGESTLESAEMPISSETTGVKAFLWSTDSLKPLCEFGSL